MKEELRKYVDGKISELQDKRLTEKQMGELSAYESVLSLLSRIDLLDISTLKVEIRLKEIQLKNSPDDYRIGRHTGFLHMKNYLEVLGA